METLGSYGSGGKSITVTFNDVDPKLLEIMAGFDPTVLKIGSLVAAATPLPQDLGSPMQIYDNILFALHQDDDAHDTCSLTACLNPLHPGPCKGWKGSLFDAAPGAWHALEAAKVEKANTARVKKIADLKAKGLPIPKKLLTPIVAKPHPHAGQTANKASGEAHEAGKAVSDAAGVHVSTPGKVSLGQAVKTMKPVQLGPKGKKPTVASKGIAHVIAQEKVTPQYKLDKAAAITPEQWDGLSAEDKATVRAELGKIKKDGFGPQQKKADELLTKLADKPAPAPAPASTGLPDGYTIEHVGYEGKHSKYALKRNGKTIKTAVGSGSGPEVELTKHAQEHAAAPSAAPKLGDGAPSAKAPPLASDEAVTKLSDTLKKVAPEAKPKPLPKHVQDAIAMAKGQAPGATWAKNHLAAYQHLTAEEFHALPKDTQDKIASDLGKAVDKLLDPKKVQASKDLLARFGKGPSTPDVDKTAKPKAAEKAVGFSTHLHDHNVTQAQAKEAVAKTPAYSHFLAGKQTANLLSEENPDSTHHKGDAHAQVEQFIDSQVAPYDDGKILSDPEVSAAVEDASKALYALKYAQSVHGSKSKAYNKVTKTLAADDGELSPIGKASLQQYQKHLLDHPVKTDSATMDQLQKDAAQAIDELHAKLQAADKKAKAPKADDMSAAQIADRAKELMGPDVDKKTFPLSNDELDDVLSEGGDAGDVASALFSDAILTDPVVAAKLGDLKKAAANLAYTKAQHAKYGKHLEDFHMKALASEVDVHGNKLTPDDKKVIAKHAAQVADGSGLEDKLDQRKAELKAAQAAFNDAANKAVDSQPPPEPVKLTDFDQATIDFAYTNAWGKHASKATVYGLKTYQQQQEMKAHADYPALTTELGQLKYLAGKVALAHAKENTAHLNVPTDPDTGDLVKGPEHTAYLAAVAEREAIEEQFAALHKSAQKHLDTVRAAVGLKKRSLPKVDSAAVKTTAAETGHYKSGAYSGPNYGKPTASKHFMLAKVGPKLAVVHKTTGDKSAEKLGDTGAPAAPKTPVSKSAPSGEPVKLGGDTSISGVPAALKKQITADFKASPSGKYLADPTEDIFDNLVTLAAAHGKNLPGGLSVDQVLKTIDETHSKNLGVPNSGMLHTKVTEWLGTAAGKEYAEKNSVASPKKVKQLLGEVTLPDGVVLGPGEKVQKVAGPGPHDADLDPADFVKATSTQAQAAQDAYMKAQGIKWSTSVKHALTEYTGSAYSTFNNYLRGKGAGTPHVKQAVIDIQSAMIPLPQHTLLKRGTGWEALPPQFRNPEDVKKLIGKTFEDPAFGSTSVAGSGGHFSGHPLQLLIEAPAGTAAAFVNGVSHYKGQENEMLLAAGTRYKVLSVTQQGGHTVLRVRIVGDK